MDPDKEGISKEQIDLIKSSYQDKKKHSHKASEELAKIISLIGMKISPAEP